MKLNLAETVLVNNPARALVQRFYEGPLLRKLGGDLSGARVLEIGCGRGNGVRTVLEVFGVAQVWAVDLDVRQAKRARRRLHRHLDGRVGIAAADAEQLPFPDEHFDAVFDFGVLHHAPRWQVAVQEIRRVLKPSGKLFFEEVTSAALKRWLYRTFLKHPPENRFSEAEFLAELAANGIEVSLEPHRILRDGIFIGVGMRGR